MASALGGFPSPSTCIASPTRKSTLCYLKNRLVSFSSLVPSLSCSSGHPSSSSSYPPQASGSKMRALSAAPEALEVEDASQPEPVEAQIASAVAEEAPKGEEVFAVVMIGGRQYIVFPGRFIYTQRLKGANANDKVVLNKVLLVGTKKNVYIGQPIVTNAVVHAVVEEQGLDPKVIVFKYKKKKNYRRTIGHRQPNTRLRIIGISGYENAPADPMPAA